MKENSLQIKLLHSIIINSWLLKIAACFGKQIATKLLRKHTPTSHIEIVLSKIFHLTWSLGPTKIKKKLIYLCNKF